MYEFKSKLRQAIIGCLDYRESFGYARQTYMVEFTSLDRFYASQYPDLEVLSKEAVMDWFGNSPSASKVLLARKAIAEKHLARYMMSLGLDAFMIPTNLVPAMGRYSPYIFSDSELSSLFEAIDSLQISADNTFPQIAPVMFRLIYTCGLRPGEGYRLKRENVNFETGEILITETKRHKERIVVMSDDMLVLCKKYDERRGVDIPCSEYFFPRNDGQPYSTNQVGKLFSKCWAAANPTASKSDLPRIRVYDLRHRFASAVLNRWLDAKNDLYAMLPYLRAYMGHHDMSDTAYYIHLIPENILKSSGIDWKSLNEILPEASNETF